MRRIKYVQEKGLGYTPMLAVGLVLFLSPGLRAQPDDVVSWRLLEKFEYKQQPGGWVPEFEEELIRLEGTEIVVRGFMTPLDQSMDQRHFILSPYDTSDCQFCLPGGPETMIEVMAARDIEYSYEFRYFKGTLVLLKNDPYGLLYRLTDTVEVD